jgi:ABC-type cobalamin transport system ATPase subunit
MHVFFFNASMQETLSTLFLMYIRDLSNGLDSADSCWLGRQGVALALLSAADVLTSKDLPVVMTFLISRALVSLFLLLLI